MKKLITVLTILASSSVLAFESGPGHMFVGEGDGRSSIPFMAGCSDAEEEAIYRAKMSCHEAGYKTCEEVETKRMYRRGANPLAHGAILVGASYRNDGVCGYKSIFEGIDSGSPAITLYGILKTSDRGDKYRNLEGRECQVDIHENAPGNIDVSMKVGEQEFKKAQLQADFQGSTPQYQVSKIRRKFEDRILTVHVHPQGNKIKLTRVNAYEWSQHGSFLRYDINCEINETLY